MDMAFQIGETMVLGTYLGILLCLGGFGLHRLSICWLYWRHKANVPQAAQWKVLPQVTVQLPIYNECHVVERLIDATCRLDWPRDRLEVQVLDDSTDTTTALCEDRARYWRGRGVDIQVLHRADRVGFKAGALKAGAAVARGEFLAIFDADFVPNCDFLQNALPHFAEAPNVGMVQARWGHLNEKQNLLTRLSAILLDGHFVLEHTARNRSGRFFNFNGTAGVWRRSCIAEAGDWQHDTLTEDLDLSYRAQLAGWHFVYLKDLVVPSELPDHMRAFKTQQHRWTKGTIQTARKLLIPLLTSGLPFRVRYEATVHLVCNICYPMVLVLAVLMPVAVFVRGHGTMRSLLLLDLPAFLMATCSIAFFYVHASRETRKSWTQALWRVPLLMSLGIGLSINQTRAFFEGVFGKDVTFVRTPKRGPRGAHRAYQVQAGWTPWVELIMAGYYAAAIAWAIVAGFWGSLPFMLLFGAGFGYVGLCSLATEADRVRPSRSKPVAHAA